MENEQPLTATIIRDSVTVKLSKGMRGEYGWEIRAQVYGSHPYGGVTIDDQGDLLAQLRYLDEQLRAHYGGQD